MPTLADLLEDARLLLRSRTVRALLLLALAVPLSHLGIAHEAAPLIDAGLTALEWALIAAAIFFRARASGPIPLGENRGL